jgi:predicted dehydrogenase
MDLPYLPGLDEALARDDVDIVSICAEHERRGRIAARCAKAGKHLYIDKPLAASVAEADAVVDAVEASGVRSQTFSFIHSPWAQAAKTTAESGKIGEIIAIHSDVMFAKGYSGTVPVIRPRVEDPHPRRFTFIDSKRELFTTGVYAIGLIRWITGAQVERVFCVTANNFFKEHIKNDVEDFGTLALALDNGITATVACGRIGWTSHQAGGPNRLRIIGTEGSLTVDMHKPRIEICADETPWTPQATSPHDPMSFWSSTNKETGTKPKNSWIPLHRDESHNDASRFVDCIESGRESEMSAKDGAAIVEVLMASYLSAAKRDIIQIPLTR